MPAEHRNLPGHRRRGDTADHPVQDGTGRRTDGVEQAGRAGTHRGQVVDVHQDRAPAGPFRIAFHHRGNERVAGGDEVGPGNRRTVVTDEPGRTESAAHRPQRGQRVAEERFRGLGKAVKRVERPAHPFVWLSGDHGLAQTFPAQGGESGTVPPLYGGLEPQHAGRLDVGTRGPDQCGSHSGGTDLGGGDQPAARPPAQIHRTDRRQPHPAQHRARGVGGHQHHGAGIVVGVIAVAAGEQPLFVDELLLAQPPVAVQVGLALGAPDEKRCGCRGSGQDGQVG
ncbi:hypothetical protein MYFR107205_02285 [Mycolicibacterium frederiksbergense]